MKTWIVVLIFCLILSGCKLIPKDGPLPPVVEAEPQVRQTWFCTTEASFDALGKFCEFNYWAKVYIEANEINWPERLNRINELGDAPVDLMYKVMMSQGPDTPYQNRLRAQNWITSLLTVVEPTMASVLDVVIFQPSQQLLELESAITILSRVNVRQEKVMDELNATLDARKEDLEKQRTQVEQLLKIEANMADQNRSQ